MIKSKIMGNPMVSAVGAIISCALWGISTPIVKMGYVYTDATHVPSLLLWAGIQFALAGLFTVCLYSVISKRFVYPKKENREGVALIAILQTVLQYACMYVGLMLTTSVKGAVHEQLDDAAYILTKYIEEHFTDTGLSLNSAAEALGYNAKYLSSCFKKMNIGFSEYVRTLRINNAVFLMEHGVESVKNVAVLLGFQDPLYFSKVFKAVIGQSSTEYIKRLHKQGL